MGIAGVTQAAEDSYQRLVWLRADIETEARRFIPEAIWAVEMARLFALDVF